MTSKHSSSTSSDSLLQATLEELDNLKALNIRCLTVKALTSFMDYMIVATGTSSRHVQSIADHLIQQMKARHFSVYNIEGDDNNEWILVDLGDIVVHIMQEKVRDFYNLEKLWSSVPLPLTSETKEPVLL